MRQWRFAHPIITYADAVHEPTFSYISDVQRSQAHRTLDCGDCSLGLPPVSSQRGGACRGGAQGRGKESGVDVTVVVIRVLFSCAVFLDCTQR